MKPSMVVHTCNFNALCQRQRLVLHDEALSHSDAISKRTDSGRRKEFWFCCTILLLLINECNFLELTC